MNFRTIIDILPSPYKITYNDKVMLIGSCFAAYIGEQMQKSRMSVMVNPAGTVYNPVSIANTIDIIISSATASKDDLFNHDGTWISFSHYTDFASEDADKLIEKINSNTSAAKDFLGKSAILFITFGTSRVYRFKGSGKIVSNCHKVPNKMFDTEILSVSETVKIWHELLDRISVFNPGLKVVFTISPVRHWKDGAHGNHVSKSVLFLAVEELLNSRSDIQYFPAYELLMDDLRDYRFYANDMLHPSDAAVDYIWEKFAGAYLSEETRETRNDVLKIVRACNHRFMQDSQKQKKIFAEKFLKHIETILNKNPGIDLSMESAYFRSLI